MLNTWGLNFDKKNWMIMFTWVRKFLIDDILKFKKKKLISMYKNHNNDISYISWNLCYNKPQGYLPKFVYLNNFTPYDIIIPFKFYWRQFSLVVSFVITMSKKSKKSIKHVGYIFQHLYSYMVNSML